MKELIVAFPFETLFAIVFPVSPRYVKRAKMNTTNCRTSIVTKNPKTRLWNGFRGIFADVLGTLVYCGKPSRGNVQGIVVLSH
jgi:hypothetical protein